MKRIKINNSGFKSFGTRRTPRFHKEHNGLSCALCVFFVAVVILYFFSILNTAACWLETLPAIEEGTVIIVLVPSVFHFSFAFVPNKEILLPLVVATFFNTTCAGSDTLSVSDK